MPNIGDAAANTFYNSMSAVQQGQFQASFWPTVNPVGDAENWVNTNIAAMNALGIMTFQNMNPAQQDAMLSSHTVPTSGPTSPGFNPNQQPSNGGSFLGGLGSILGLPSTTFQGGLRHFLIRGIEIIIGIGIIYVAIKGAV